jgi:hypothetical protein
MGAVDSKAGERDINFGFPLAPPGWFEPERISTLLAPPSWPLMQRNMQAFDAREYQQLNASSRHTARQSS